MEILAILSNSVPLTTPTHYSRTPLRGHFWYKDAWLIRTLDQLSPKLYITSVNVEHYGASLSEQHTVALFG